MKSKVLFCEDDRLRSDMFTDYIEELGLTERLRAARSVAIKPNLCAGTAYTSDSAVVTQKRVLEDLIVCVSTIAPDAIIYIAESDSTGKGYAWQKFEFQGYTEFLEHYPNVRLLDLSRDKLRIINMVGDYFDELELSETLLDADFYINMAKMKTHNITTITGIVKNQFGILPHFDKSGFHPHLNAVLADLVRVKKPDLCIVEGAPPMEGNGPVAGVPKKNMKLILLSNDPVAVDSVAADVMGFCALSIPHIKYAASRGLGEKHLDCIEHDHEALERNRRRFKFVSSIQRCMCGLGLGIQRLGAGIVGTGHEVHCLASPLQAWKPIARWIYHIAQRSRLKPVRNLMCSLKRNYKKWKSQTPND